MATFELNGPIEFNMLRKSNFAFSFEPTRPPSDGYRGCWEGQGLRARFTVECDQDGAFNVCADTDSPDGFRFLNERAVTADYAMLVCRLADRDGFGDNWDHHDYAVDCGLDTER